MEIILQDYTNTCFVKKSVHTIGCSVSIPDSNEGYGQKRVCKDCDRKKSEKAKNNATEVWKKNSYQKNKIDLHIYILFHNQV
jgi:hypothetical protein